MRLSAGNFEEARENQNSFIGLNSKGLAHGSWVVFASSGEKLQRLGSAATVLMIVYTLRFTDRGDTV